jgi:CDP-diacylglycerol--glycerol-3-phosphate 3-phosphatidyltransferase
MGLADQLTLVRVAAVPIVVVLYEWNVPSHDWWATGIFIAAMSTDWFDGRVARSQGRTSPLGSLLDPVADKLLVLTVLIVLIGQDIFPGWMVAAIVAREFLVSGLRLAALERGVVMHARDLGKLKTWSQATAAAIGGFAAAGAWSTDVAWWALLVALVLTWVSGLDYARGPRDRLVVLGLRVLADSRLAPTAAIGGRQRRLREQAFQRCEQGATLFGARLRRDLGVHPAAD